MKITSIDKEIKKVLETGYYHIPRFQRPYSWEKDHISDFLADTIKDSETDYFIGSIVVFKKNEDMFGIVDGQQRLTTITMILCSLRDLYLIEGFENPAKGVHQLIERVDLNNDKKFILQTETSYPYFQEHIQKFGSPEINIDFGQEEENLKNGFEQIQKYISNEIDYIKTNNQIPKDSLRQRIGEKLNEIRDKILKLKVIYIELDNEDDAYIIFETLNTRGKDLSVGDLVKNYLTKLLKAHNKDVDIPKEKWSQIRDNIDSTSKDLDVDTFLSHVWLSKYEYISTKLLFKRLKKTIKKDNARGFLDNLVQDSSIYKSIFDTDTKKWQRNEIPIKKSLSALSTFNVAQQTPMVLSIMREYENGNLRFKLTRDALQAIEHFHYIFNAITSQRSSGSIASMYSQYARFLSSAKDDNTRQDVIRELRKKMNDKLPTFAEFLAAFNTFKYTSGFTKQKRIIQYTLIKMDEYFSNNGNSINYDMMTIEHILPENPKNTIKNNEAFVGMLGNLILVNELTNNQLANRDFDDKLSILTSANINLDEYIKNADEWTQKEIEERTEEMASDLYFHVFKI